MNKTTGFLVLLLLLASPSLGLAAGSPCDGDWCYPCSMEQLDGVLMISPAGNGPTLAELGLTITVHVRACDGGLWDEPFPAEEIEVSGGNSGVSFCSLPMADADTDLHGTATFSGSWAGGGWAEGDGGHLGQIRVWVYGLPAVLEPIRIGINSPDLTGDLRVDLADVGEFGLDFFGPYSFRSDLFYDGVINLADLGRLAMHLGEECP